MPREHMVVLVFEVDGHRYGVDTTSVREVVRAVLPARLPRAPAVIAGVVNVRGELVPVVDLRRRFGLAATPIRASEVFVLVRSAARTLAFRADAARELLRVRPERIAPIGAAVARAEHTAGAALLPDGLLLLCDVELFLDEAERATLADALASEPLQVAP